MNKTSILSIGDNSEKNLSGNLDQLNINNNNNEDRAIFHYLSQSDNYSEHSIKNPNKKEEEINKIFSKLNYNKLYNYF